MVTSRVKMKKKK